MDYNFRNNCVRTAKAGGDTFRRRGEVRVNNSDGTFYFYKISRKDLREFKNWLRAVWNETEDNRITGQFPSYTAEPNRE